MWWNFKVQGIRWGFKKAITFLCLSLTRLFVNGAYPCTCTLYVQVQIVKNNRPATDMSRR